MKIVNDDKSKAEYRAFLTVFYGLICFLSFNQIVGMLSGHFAKTSQLMGHSIKFGPWTYMNFVIIGIIAILSIVILILVIKKKLPKFNLIFPICGILFFLFWVYMIPRVTWILANSVEDFLLMIKNQDKYDLIFLIIEFVFSLWVLLRLWNVIKEGREHFIWKDKFKMLVLVVIPVLFAFLFVYLTLITSGYLTKIIYLILLIPYLYLIYRVVRFQRIYITKRGIFIHDYFLYKGSFLNWAEILNILIVEKYVSTGKYSAYHKELIIKTKDKRKYTGTIFDFQGFIIALRKLNKYRLLDKNSKYK